VHRPSIDLEENPMSKRTFSAFVSAAVLAFGVGACGDDEEDAGTAGASAQQEQTEQQRPEPVAQIDQLSGERTSVMLDSGFLEALEMLQVTPGPVGDAKISESGTATFPITGGNVTYYEPGTVSPFVQGMILHQGSGLSLEAGGKRVELTDFVVDPGASVLTGTVTVDGEEAVSDAPLFFLDGRTLEPLMAKDDATAVLQGTTVKLKAEAADLLNETFGITALEEGLEIGTAKITVNTQ
jgi:hypothetical protein